MEQYDDIIRLCTLDNNVRREFNQIDSADFFKRYVVCDTSDNWKKYAACLTDAKIYRSKEIEGDFTLKIKVNVKLGNELKSAYETYKNVLTTGRSAFQDFAEDFELWDKVEEETSHLDFSKLNNKYCIAKVNTANQLKGISNVIIGDSAKDKEIINFFESHIENAHTINLKSIPIYMKYYRYIPSTIPESEYLPNVEYHGCIRDVDCEKNGNDINVKIAAYVFNGGKTRVIAKFFNKIKTTGKSEFNEFCKMYDIVDDDGKIKIEELTGRPSKIILCENSRGNKYINSLKPLHIEYTEYYDQYEILVKKNNQLH